MKNVLKIDYPKGLKELLEFELENGSQLKEGFTVDSAIEDFMNNDMAVTIFDLKEYLK